MKNAASKTTKSNKAVAKVLAEIAVKAGFETLEERKSDRLDFATISVLTMKEALEAAYAAGRASK